MVLDRALVSVGVVLIVGWGLAVTLNVLSDEQLPADAALGIILATAVIPGFIGLCVIGLLWPIVRVMAGVRNGDAEGSFTKSARVHDLCSPDRLAQHP